MKKHAYIFPGQGSQFAGMGKNLYDTNNEAKQIFEDANDILGFRISDIMFNGTEDELKRTDVTQPAVFIHSIAACKVYEGGKADMVAGHSLGEFSALVANSAMSFEEGLKLVSIRASAMQKACELQPSMMAAILGLSDSVVEQKCRETRRETGEIVVPANYNCPGQVVISGSIKGIEEACKKMMDAGAKRAMPLHVGGAFHSPLMQPAKAELEAAINNTHFKHPVCSVYQNVSATAVNDPEAIKQNLIDQLTGSVRWTQSIIAMTADGCHFFTEIGPGKVLIRVVNKTDYTVEADAFG